MILKFLVPAVRNYVSEAYATSFFLIGMNTAFKYLYCLQQFRM